MPTAKLGAMKTEPQPDRRLDALLAALSRNRGEIDAASLARLLRLVEATAGPKSRPA